MEWSVKKFEYKAGRTIDKTLSRLNSDWKNSCRSLGEHDKREFSRGASSEGQQETGGHSQLLVYLHGKKNPPFLYGRGGGNKQMLIILNNPLFWTTVIQQWNQTAQSVPLNGMMASRFSAKRGGTRWDTTKKKEISWPPFNGTNYGRLPPPTWLGDAHMPPSKSPSINVFSL